MRSETTTRSLVAEIILELVFIIVTSIDLGSPRLIHCSKA